MGLLRVGYALFGPAFILEGAPQLTTCPQSSFPRVIQSVSTRPPASLFLSSGALRPSQRLSGAPPSAQAPRKLCCFPASSSGTLQGPMSDRDGGALPGS